MQVSLHAIADHLQMSIWDVWEWVDASEITCDEIDQDVWAVDPEHLRRYLESQAEFLIENAEKIAFKDWE